MRQTPNTSRRSFDVSKNQGPNRGVLQCAGVFSGVSMQGRHRAPFGFSPKISTPVENTVEKQVKRLMYRWKWPIYRDFWPGEGR